MSQESAPERVHQESATEKSEEGFSKIRTPDETVTASGDQAANSDENNTPEETLAEKIARVEQELKELKRKEEDSRKEDAKKKEEELRESERELRAREQEVKISEEKLEAAKKRVREQAAEVQQKRARITSGSTKKQQTSLSTAENAAHMGTRADPPTAYKSKAAANYSLEGSGCVFPNDPGPSGNLYGLSASSSSLLTRNIGTKNTRKAKDLTYYTQLDVTSDDEGKSFSDMDLSQLRSLASKENTEGGNVLQKQSVAHINYFIFLKTDAIDDLERAIHQAEGQIPTDPDDPGYQPRLKDLIVMLAKRYERTNSVDDLEVAIFRAVEMVSVTALDHPSRPSKVGDWIILMLEKCSRTGLESDLIEAMHIAGEAGAVITVDDSESGKRTISVGIQIGREQLTSDEITSKSQDTLRETRLKAGIAKYIQELGIDSDEIPQDTLAETFLSSLIFKSNDLESQVSTLKDTIQDLQSINHKLTSYFQHTPFPERGTWIRLLRLLPGTFEEPICCELVPTEFEKAPPYETISYCWGDSNDKQQIFCHGKLYPITVNLYQALRRFRHKSEPRLLWADGLCIDQNSPAEKARQVPFMDKIYARAERTLIWLGENRGYNMADGISLIKEFNAYMWSQLDSKDITSLTDIPGYIDRLPPLPDDHALVTCKEREKSVHELLHRPWFERVWVLQEVGLSKTVDAYCGVDRIAFVEIVQFALYGRVMRRHGYPKIMNAMLSIWSGYEKEESWMNEGFESRQMTAYSEVEENWLDVLVAGRDYKATVPADHIYAFLGHPRAKRADRSSIIDVNYDRTVEETSRLLAETIAIETWSLEVLCYVHHTVDEDVEGSTPSWVPLWHKRNRYNKMSPQSYYDASCSEETADQMVIDISGNDLRVTALLLDTVTNILPGRIHGDIEEFASFVQSCWQLCSQSSKFNHEHPRFGEVLPWNLVGSYPGPIRERPRALASDFFAFCQEHFEHKSPEFFSLITSGSFFADIHPMELRDAHRFVQRAKEQCYNRTCFVTHTGFFGLGLRPIRKGDILAIIFGCPMPVLLRPLNPKNPNLGELPPYKLVGPAYVHGLMLGQAIQTLKDGNFIVSAERTEIILV